MTRRSYPAAGNNGMDVGDWSGFWPGEDGIIGTGYGSAGGNATITRIDSGNIARFGTMRVRVGGYIFEVTGTEDLVIPTAAGDYHIWVRYEPLINIEDPDTHEANPAGPCSLGYSLGDPPTSAGQQYVLLYRIVRASGQALSAAPMYSYRQWVTPGGVMVEGIQPEFFDVTPPVGLGPWARGTRLFDRTTHESWVRGPRDGGGYEWESLDYTYYTFPAPSALVALDAPAQYYRKGNHIFLQGTLKRSSGASLSTGNDVILGTMPAGHRPDRIKRFACYAGSGHVVGVKVEAAGTVTMYDPPSYIGSVAWIDLSTIHYEIGN